MEWLAQGHTAWSKQRWGSNLVLTLHPVLLSLFPMTHLGAKHREDRTPPAPFPSSWRLYTSPAKQRQGGRRKAGRIGEGAGRFFSL